MPTLQCPSCGKTVKFEGIAGVCPFCAAIVRSAKPVSPRKPAPATPPIKSNRQSRRGVELNDLESMDGGEEVFEPAESPESGGSFMSGLAGLDRRLVYSIYGAIALVAIFGLYVVFRHPKADDVVTQTPSPPLSFNLTQPPPQSDPVPHPPEPPPISTLPVIPPSTRPVFRPAWAGIKPMVPTPKVEPINDKLVEKSIQNGSQFLKSQFKDGALTDTNNNASHGGGDALAIYALLHSGQAIDDPDLNSSSAFVRDILDRVKEYDMNGSTATYERSLRTAALGFFDREADRDQLGRDRQWLLKAELNGAYGYVMPPAGATTAASDNSTSQFGVLGIWSAAAAGQPIPDKYWNDVVKHWLASQDTDGGWPYVSQYSTSTMTCAGVTTLTVAAEFQALAETTKSRPSDVRPAFSRAVNRGLDYLAKDDNILNTGSNPSYGLYAVERAALATGFRWFGKHDWYRELGAQVIKAQFPDGSWNGRDGIDVETSFSLLFLSRGRQPLLMDKLRFNGDWDNRPRDVAKMAQFVSTQLEKPFAWGVADLDREWQDWLESPILFISTDSPPNFSDEECNKLRSYTEAGGLIFIHNEFGSKLVDGFVRDLSKRLFPDYPLTPMPLDHLLYSAVFPMKAKPPMESVSNGTRTLLIYSPGDITQEWVRYRFRDARPSPSMQLGLNLFVYGAGKSDFRNRLNSPYISAILDPAPLTTVPVYQISYPGPWNCEPGAWERFPRWFQTQTSIALDVHHADIRGLDHNGAPFAVLTGNADVDFSKIDVHALHDYVNQGGVLFIDSTGGNKAFSDSVRQFLLPRAFPNIQPTGIAKTHPILAGIAPCTDRLPKPRVRNYTASLLSGAAPGVQFALFGKGAVIISDLDVTTGLLDCGSDGIYGYSPAYCQSLMKNVILWTLSRYPN